jgi:hypothetical protein
MSRKHNISETVSIFVIRWGEGDTLLGPLEIANLSHWMLFSISLEFKVMDKVHKLSDPESLKFQWNSAVSNFMKIHPAVLKLLHVDIWTDKLMGVVRQFFHY